MTYTITRPVYDALAQVARDVVQDGRTREDYSGRCMNGQSCLALVCPDVTGLVQFTFGISAAIEGEVDDVAEQLSSLVNELSSGYQVRVDQLGYDTVYYWPEVQVEPRA